MTPDASHLQFSRQTWQMVSDQARRTLMHRDFCPEQSRVDNLRCIAFEEEGESSFGRQLWFYEALGVDPLGRRRALYGALEFSIQFGLMEPARSSLFEQVEQRQRYVRELEKSAARRVWQHASTRFWIRTALAGVTVVTLVWGLMLIQHFSASRSPAVMSPAVQPGPQFPTILAPSVLPSADGAGSSPESDSPS
jgi:hypothetical protein